MIDYRRTMTITELEYLATHAKSPADLIELLPRLGLDPDFADFFCLMWKKPYDEHEDNMLLEKIARASDHIRKEFPG